MGPCLGTSFRLSCSPGIGGGCIWHCPSLTHCPAGQHNCTTTATGSYSIINICVDLLVQILSTFAAMAQLAEQSVDRCNDHSTDDQTFIMAVVDISKHEHIGSHMSVRKHVVSHECVSNPATSDYMV